MINGNCQKGLIPGDYLFCAMQRVKFGTLNIQLDKTNFFFAGRIVYGGDRNCDDVFPFHISISYDVTASIKIGSKGFFAGMIGQSASD